MSSIKQTKIESLIIRRSISLTTLILSTGWITLFLMVTGPNVLPGLPGFIDLHDLFFLIFLAFLCTYITRGKNLRLPSDVILVAFSFYLFLVIIIPIIGVIYYQDYVSWIMGDLRWIQIVLLFVGLYYAYSGINSDRLEKHTENFIWALLLFQIPIILTQALILIANISPPFYMEFWYPDGRGGYGYYGQHIGRFAGAMNRASGLALIGGLGFTYSVLSIYNRPKVRYFVLFLIGLTIMIAAGNRAMLLGVPLLTGGIIFLKLAKSLRVKKRLITVIVIAIPSLIGLFAILYHYNVGRIATSNRYQQIFDLMFGRASFQQITGRGEDRWMRPILEAFEHWSPMGTLVNSSHALNHLPAFDSYIVFAIAQAGPLILIPFIILVGIIFIRGVSGYIKKYNSKYLVSLSFIIPIFIAIFTQNTMTSMTGRFFLLISILFLIVRNFTKKK